MRARFNPATFAFEGTPDKRAFVRVREASRSFELLFAHGHAVIHRTDDCAEIVDLFVDEAHRGQGLGAEYVAFAVSFCASGMQGVTTVVAHVEPSNLPSHRAFTRHGFVTKRSEDHMEYEFAGCKS